MHRFLLGIDHHDYALPYCPKDDCKNCESNVNGTWCSELQIPIDMEEEEEE